MAYISEWTKDDEAVIVLRPSRSMNWKQNKAVVLVVAAVVGSVAVPMAFLGFWPVLPFAGLEVAALWYALYLTQRKLMVAEKLTIRQTEICIERGIESVDESLVIPRQWSRLCYRKSEEFFDIGELSIRWHANRALIARSLGEAGREEAFEALKPHFDAVEVRKN